MPLSADSLPGDHDASHNFIDSIGVNTHLNAYGSNPYADYRAVKAALVGLGVRHIRDEFNIQNLNHYEDNLADLAASGIHSDLLLTESEDAKNFATIDVSGTRAATYLQAGHFAQSIEAIEGINEPDEGHGPTGQPATNWVAITRDEQKNLYVGIQGLHAPAKRIPVYGPSVINSADLPQLGNISQFVDFGNIHNYSGGYVLTPASIASAVASAATISGTKPVLASENGYSTGSTGQGMPDEVMLDYAQRLFFKQFANNVNRTVWYQFVDQTATANDYWNNSGLITSSYRIKPAYTGLQNVIRLLSDQTPYTQRTPLNVTFGEQTPDEKLTHLLLQKNDGSYWLAVWSDVSEWTPAKNGVAGAYPVPAPTSQANSLNFLGTYVASIIEYDEDANGTMTSKPLPVDNGRVAEITVHARPTIYKIVPGTAPAPPAAPIVNGPAAHWALDEVNGTIAADSIDAAGNLSVPGGSPQVAWIAGKYNDGLAFSGTQATTAKTPIDTSASYSAVAWVQLKSLTGFQAAVTVNGTKQAAFALDYTPQSNLSYTTYPSDSAGGGTRIGSTTVPVIGTWYAVAATYNGTTHKMSFYLNGVLQGTAMATKVFRGTGGTEIGSMEAAGVGHYQWWFGGIDEVNLYQRELSSAEVAKLAAL